MKLEMSKEFLHDYIQIKPKTVVDCIHNDLKPINGIKLNWEDTKTIALWLVKKHKVNLFSVNTSGIPAHIFILTMFIDETNKHKHWIVERANLARIETVRLYELLEVLKRIPKSILIELLQTT